MPPASAWLKQRLRNPFCSLPESSDSSGKMLITLKWLPGGWRKSKHCQHRSRGPGSFSPLWGASWFVWMRLGQACLCLQSSQSHVCLTFSNQLQRQYTHTPHCGALECTSYLISCPAIVCRCHWATKHECTSHSACSSQSWIQIHRLLSSPRRPHSGVFFLEGGTRPWWLHLKE